MSNRQKIIAVDFDGTIVRRVKDAHLYKDFELMLHAKEVVAWLYENFFVILWTSRTGEPLQNALNFLDRNGIVFHAVNENAPFLDFETSAKIFSDFYADDRSIMGTVDWLAIRDYLQKKYLTVEHVVVTRVLIED